MFKAVSLLLLGLALLVQALEKYHHGNDVHFVVPNRHKKAPAPK